MQRTQKTCYGFSSR